MREGREDLSLHLYLLVSIEQEGLLRRRVEQLEQINNEFRQREVGRRA